MKKIFFILENLGEGGGGAERVVVNLCNELSKKNTNVSILSLTDKGNFYKRKINEEVKLKIFPFNKSIYSTYHFYSYLKKTEPNIVFSTSFHISLLTILMKILLPNKFFLISRISNNIGEYFKNYKSIQLSVVHFLYFKLFKYIDKVVCPSKGLVQELKKKTIKKYYNKIELINNPVDYKYIIRQSKLKFSNNYLKKRFILNIGRLVVNKDHYTLVKSFKYFLKINKKKLNYILIIIGNGPLYHKLLNFIKKEGLKHKIIILQKINNPYIFIRKAKLFVLSSIFEGNPNVLLEAQVLKKKIISTDCNYGPREILEDGKYGYLVEKGDYKNLGLKMIKALKNKNMSIKYKKLMKKNSLKLISMKYQNLFKSLNEQ